MSILAKGTVKVELEKLTGEKVEKEFTAPSLVVIRKGCIHNITALTDDVLWYCIFANRDVDGNVFTEDMDILNTSANEMDLTKFTIEDE